MKKLVLILLFITCTLSAQKNNKQSKNVEDNFIIALQSENDGLVENSIFQLVICSLWGKNMGSNQIISELEFLKKNGSTEQIKEMSNIAVEFFKRNNSMLRSTIKCNYLDQEKLFKVISEILKKDNKENKTKIIVKE